MTLGSAPFSARRASTPSVRPVSASVCGRSLYGKRLLGLRLAWLEGWAKR